MRHAGAPAGQPGRPGRGARTGVNHGQPVLGANDHRSQPRRVAPDARTDSWYRAVPPDVTPARPAPPPRRQPAAGAGDQRHTAGQRRSPPPSRPCHARLRRSPAPAAPAARPAASDRRKGLRQDPSLCAISRRRRNRTSAGGSRRCRAISGMDRGDGVEAGLLLPARRGRRPWYSCPAFKQRHATADKALDLAAFCARPRPGDAAARLFRPRRQRRPDFLKTARSASGWPTRCGSSTR